MSNYRKTMAKAMEEVYNLTEASMSSSQIAMLKKAYEPMRDKKISVGNANKLSALMDKFADNKDVLIQLVKADIPFVSTAAVTRLISKHGMKGAEINKFKKEEMEFWAELDEGKEKDARQLIDPKKEVLVVKRNEVIVIDKVNQDYYLKKGWSLAEETELDEVAARGKKFDDTKIGIGTPVEIEDKSGKAHKGRVVKVNRKDDKVTISIDDGGTIIAPRSKVSVVREEVELDEMNSRDKILKKTSDHLQALIKGSNNPDDKAAFAAARDYVEAGNLETVVTIVKKLDTAPREAIINAVAKGMGKKEAEKIFKVRILRIEEVEVEEGAAADARRHARQDKDLGVGKDSADVDDDATDDDVKGASKNIIMQMRKSVNLRGTFPVEFNDKKKVKVSAKVAQAVQDKFNSIKKPADKEKFQAQVAKSYKDMLKVLKAGYNEQKESILNRIDRKLKENKNG